ncbi:hypothetical protein EV1_043342 [Malus domestica]
MFCSKFNINLCFAFPAHPQSNGQVKAINKIIKRTLKTSLDKAKGWWPEFVPQVLWSYCTSYRTSTGETPFSLAFGDWVLKKRLLCDRVPSEGTLSLNWDGPFEVVGISRPGSYKLRSSDGKTLGHPWNVDHLKYYYK